MTDIGTVRDTATGEAIGVIVEGVPYYSEAYVSCLRDEKRTLVQAITLAASGNPDREPTPGDPIGMVEALAADAASLRADVARLWGENERLKESLEARAGWRESQDRINNRVYNGCPKEYARDTVSESIVAWLNGTIEEAASLRARLAECEKNLAHEKEEWRTVLRWLAAQVRRESMPACWRGLLLQPERGEDA